MVFGVLEEWMAGQLRGKAASCKEAGEHEKAMEWNQTMTASIKNLRRGSGCALSLPSASARRRSAWGRRRCCSTGPRTRIFRIC
jgi:hypothetical protein